MSNNDVIYMSCASKIEISENANGTWTVRVNGNRTVNNLRSEAHAAEVREAIRHAERTAIQRLQHRLRSLIGVS